MNLAGTYENRAELLGRYRLNWPTLLIPERIRPSHHEQDLDTRNVFEQDYHRIILSASFRRLQDKTQVFPLDQSDFVRTRLTHSLEVSSLARSLGQTVAHELYFRNLDPSLSPELERELCDLLLASGLVHDIGNPPFGHYGETTIRDWFRRHLPQLRYHDHSLAEWLSPAMQADFLEFEGNAQALRVLCKLHFLVDEHGMNLTLPLLHTLIKYPIASTQIQPQNPDIRFHKMGYFQAEQALFDRITTRCGTRSGGAPLETGCRHPLTYLLEAADDISYRTADIEDAYKKGRFTYGQLLDELQGSRGLAEVTARDRADYLELVAKLPELRRQADGREIRNPELYALQNWLVRVQSRMIQESSQAFCDNYAAIMNGCFQQELFRGTGKLIMETLGDIATRYVFRSRLIVQLEIAANTIISGLLDKFVPACLYWDTADFDSLSSSLEPRLMEIVSDNYKASYRFYAQGQDEAGRLYLRLLLITDYICGMTDSFAKTLYQKINGIY
ncbi:deoxyguanosinetriphosphate triphosphohydrolase [Oscillospiraceae bacterium HV4-5-C5C]|nr:deoxyguanosinetriphosphate triphosphohydrolase [Oscillospiraceae bacterium HV4-5-C5C]